PRLPPAPGLLSTVTGCASSLESSAAVEREAMSTAPAGGKGQISRIGLFGKGWASAPWARRRDASAARTEANGRDTGWPFEGRVTRNYALGGRGQYRRPAPAGETPRPARDLRLLRRRRRGRDHPARQSRRLRARAAAAEGAGRRFPGENRGGSPGQALRPAAGDRPDRRHQRRARGRRADPGARRQ